MKLANRHIHSRLADGVARRNVQLVLVHRVEIRHARGQGDDFLGGAGEDEGHVEVEEVDVCYDVYFEGFEEVLFEGLGVFASVGGEIVSFRLLGG